MLQTLWENLEPGYPHLVLITGEAGIGKSRLAEEFLYWANQRGATVARTRSWAGEGRIAYAPVTNLLRSEVLRPQLARLNDIWLAQIARLLPEVREERQELPHPDPLQEEWQRQHFFDALVRAILIHNKPLILLFDDLQWCDQQTLEWLRFLLHSGDGKQLLVIGTARIEAIADNESLVATVRNLRQADQITEVELAPLDQSDVTLLANRMAGRPLEAELLAQLYRKAEGNPLFVIETVRAGIRAEGETHPGAAASPETKGSVPPKIQAVIQSRLAQLSPAAQELTAVAATIGRSFTVAVLAGAWRQDETSLIWGLDELWRRRIVREQGADAYDFSHDRIREVVYEQLSPTLRRMLHRHVAQAIEQLYSANLDELSGELGLHFERAGENEKALRYWLRAANHALDTHALGEALSDFERALLLAENPSLQADAYFGLARTHFALDALETALSNVAQAQRLLAAADPRSTKFFHLQAEIYFAQYEIDQAQLAALAMQQAAGAAGDQEALCQSLSLLGQICSARGDLDQEITLITRALHLCRQGQNRWREGRTLADLGWLQAQRAEFAAAVASAEQALAILETTDDRAGVAFTWNVLGRAHGGGGSYNAAFAAFRRSQEVATTINHKFLLAQVPNMLGWLHEQLCDYAGALALDQQGLEMAERWGKTPAAISARINMATDLLNLGDPQAALSQLLDVQRQIEQKSFGFHGWRWQLRLLYGEGLCRLALGQAEQACALARAGITLAKSTTSRKYVAFHQALLGMAQAQIGAAEDAISSLASAIEVADEIGYQPLRWEGRCHLAGIHAATGQPDQAQILLHRAEQIVDTIAGALTPPPLRSIFLSSAPVQAITQALQHPAT
jgi:tetratricopeptide (TPR) repeat protein